MKMNSKAEGLLQARLRRLRLSHVGLWYLLSSYAESSDIWGYSRDAGRPITSKNLSYRFRTPIFRIKRWLRRLVAAKLISVDRRGYAILPLLEYAELRKKGRVPRGRPMSRATRERAKVRSQRRRAKIMKAAGSFGHEDWQNVLAYFGNRCAYCHQSSMALHIEHMTPLAGGGEHSATNVVPACAGCNSRKGTMTALEFVTGFWLSRRASTSASAN